MSNIHDIVQIHYANNNKTTGFQSLAEEHTKSS